MAVGINNIGVGVANAGTRAERRDAQKKLGDPHFLKTFHKMGNGHYRTTPNGLKVAVIKDGVGNALSNGMRVKVSYTGWLENGTKFDSSLDRKRPFEFKMGEGRVIKGWEEGLAGIKPGERRQLIIPAHLAYGNRKMGEIPAGSTLVFNVEAVAVEAPAANPKGNMNIVA